MIEGGLGQHHRRPRHVDLAERGTTELFPASGEQRVVRAGERDAIDHDQRQGLSGDVDPLEEPGGGEQTGLLVVRERVHQRRLRQVALGQDRELVAQPLAERLGGFVHGSVTGEQGQRAATRSANQCVEFVVRLGAERRCVGVRQVDRAVEHRVRLVVERAADVDDVDGVGGDADSRRERGRDRGTGEDRRPSTPHSLGHRRADIEWCDLETWGVARSGHECDVPLAALDGDVELLDRPAGHRLGTQSALFRILVRRLDRGQRVVGAGERQASG